MNGFVHTKHFSLDEARNELTAVHALISKMTELKATLDEMGWDLRRHTYFGGMGPNGDGTFPPEMEQLVEIMMSLDRRGVLVKSIEDGLVDFPCLRDNGEEVYLCWKLGEDDIGWWHGLDSGFAGRKRVDEL